MKGCVFKKAVVWFRGRITVRIAVGFGLAFGLGLGLFLS